MNKCAMCFNARIRYSVRKTDKYKERMSFKLWPINPYDAVLYIDKVYCRKGKWARDYKCLTQVIGGCVLKKITKCEFFEGE